MQRSSDDSDDDIPLHHKRPFGTGLKRKRVEFVRATDPDGTITAVEKARKAALVGDLYASIVLAKPLETGAANSATTNQPSKPTEPTQLDEKSDAQPPVCPVCALPITSSLAQHEASLAHQVSLQHSHPPSALDRSRMGLRALAAKGWDLDARQGLGRDGEGMRFPIKVVAKEDTLGIGATLPERRVEKEKPRMLNPKEQKIQAEKDRIKGERLQAEIFGRVDVERYLRGNGDDGI